MVFTNIPNEDLGNKVSTPMKWKLLHTKLDLVPDFSSSTMEGTAEITLVPYAYPQMNLELDAQGMVIKEINIGKDAGTEAWSYNKKKLNFTFNKAYDIYDTLLLKISYTARPEILLDSGIISKDDQKGLYFINPSGKDPTQARQVWSQGETNCNSVWFPTIDEPNQKMTQDIMITVDSNLVTLSNGHLEYSTANSDGTRTDAWVQDKPHAPYLCMMAAGDWSIVKDSWRDSIPVDYYLEKKYVPYAKLIFGNTPEMLEFYSKLLGYDYPWDKYSQVVARDFVSGAMENTSATVHFDKLMHDNRSHLDATYEEYISHELFHNWFGDLVTCESWSNLSLNESFATLGEYLWVEHKDGQDEFGLKLKHDRDRYLAESGYLKNPIIQYNYKDEEDLFDRLRYEKGGLVLQMLRTYLGDKVFFNSLKLYLHEHEFGTAEIADLRMAFEKVSGEDLNWFFNEWFLKSGKPDLLITNAYEKEKQQVKLIVYQVQSLNEAPVFRIPVWVNVTYDGGNTRKMIWLNHQIDTFLFACPAEFRNLNFDEQKTLVCTKMEFKSNEEWYYQFYHASNFLEKWEALSSLTSLKSLGQDTLLKITLDALNDPFWNIRQEAISMMQLHSHDTVIQVLFRKLESLAMHDKNSSVRQSAVQALSNVSSDFKFFYKILNTDSSYSVISSAFTAYKKLKTSDTASLIPVADILSKNTGCPELLLKASSIYSEEQDETKFPFFHKLPYLLDKGDIYSYYSDYKTLVMPGGWKSINNEWNFIRDTLSLFASKITNRITYIAMLDDYKKLLEVERKNPALHATDVNEIDALLYELNKLKSDLLLLH